ncbi:Fn3 domain-containing protein [Natranaerovirga hydrolytica]|uniref:Fn3 domain-containing protein n=1 Tax=Natranaerovirga hydrolytica TaxID=680378 RepID=A0A4R1MZN8_9FIRM|nr:CotH kinase family protein [Natranaerovirga hydrolytica]TCK98818.1 Fn3 domain-containing protein [Natranaerovirga hydrolytica]
MKSIIARTILMILIVIFFVGCERQHETSFQEKQKVTQEVSIKRDETQITFLDKNLHKAILEHLEKEDKDIILMYELENIEELNINNKSIHRIDGLENLNNLKKLNINSNYISDLTPINNLKYLEELKAQENQIRDFTPLLHLIRNNKMKKIDITDNWLVNLDQLVPYWTDDYIDERKPDSILSSDTVIYINEIMGFNTETIADGEGEYVDWVELYNPNDETIDLSNFHLSDDEEDYFLWQFPEGTQMKGKEYLLVWGSRKDTIDSNGEWHTNFSIGTDPLILSDAEGKIVDYVPTIVMPKDYSFGRSSEDSNEWVFFDEESVSPREENPIIDEVFVANSNMNPYFSIESGFYEETFVLELHKRNENETIYYTLDGSTPDPVNNSESTYEYTGAITIESDEIISSSELTQETHISMIPTTPGGWRRDRGWQRPLEVYQSTVVRARTYREDQFSEVVTHTYFVDEKKSKTFNVPIVSITVDKEDLFGRDNGIYVPNNYYNRGRHSEKEGHITFFETDGTVGFSQNIGLRIHGQESRMYPLKSLRLYARRDYDSQSSIEYELFPNRKRQNNEDKIIDSFDRVLLRASGQDIYYGLLRDALLDNLVSSYTKVDTQGYRPTLVFINGEYWGLHDIRERFDTKYIKEHYNVDEEYQITILENNAQLDKGNIEGQSHYEDMIQYLKNNDIRQEEHYEYIQTQMDINNFIDYMIIKIYAGDNDWPGNNVRYWRYNKGSLDNEEYGLDGKWRWMLFDTDFGFDHPAGGYGSYRINHISTATKAGGTSWPNPDWSTYLLRRLLQNPSFENKFITRYNDLLNTAFHPERVLNIIEEMEEAIEGEIDRHIKRWGHPLSVDVWQEQVGLIKRYGENREEYARNHIRQYFGLSQPVEVMMIFDPNKAKIRVNTIKINGEINQRDIMKEDRTVLWDGKYFKNFPITLTVEEKEGSQFSHWEISGKKQTGTTIEVIPNKGLEIKPILY